jgi:hypothetical protein
MLYFLISGTICIHNRDLRAMDATSDDVCSHEPLQRLDHSEKPVPESTAPENSPEVTSSHIKRPLNAFMLWSQKQRRRFAHNNPQMPQSEISKQLGAEWRCLSEPDKHPFIEEAKKLKRQHELDYPNYKFVQRRKRKDRANHAAGNAASVLRNGTSSTPADNNSATFPYPSYTYVNSAPTFSTGINGLVPSSMPPTFTDFSTPSLSSTLDALGFQQEGLRNLWPFLGYTAGHVSNLYPSGVPYFPSNLMMYDKDYISGNMSLDDTPSAFRP